MGEALSPVPVILKPLRTTECVVDALVRVFVSESVLLSK